MKITIENVSKSYGKKQALNGVSFEMENGVYGLLGPNGAGKSTLICILVGVMDASSGEVYMNGRNRKSCAREYRSKIGYLPQSLDFYPEFSGLDYLRFVAALKGMESEKAERKIETLIKQVHLTQDIHRKAITYSGGMKRRLGIAQALLNDPEILILDEPTAGLDPHERIKFRNLVSIFSRDRTVLLSTHIVTDIDSISKKTVMIKDGKVGRMESNQNFVDAMNGKVWLNSLKSPPKFQVVLKCHAVKPTWHQPPDFLPFNFLGQKKCSLNSKYGIPELRKVKRRTAK